MKKVVIVGGGFCGLRVARILESRFAVTLIDTKPYFEYTPSVLKLMTGDPKRYRKDFSAILKKTTFLQGEAQFRNNSIVVGKEKIPYDYAVLATGFVPFMPLGKDISDATSGESIMQARDRLHAAKTVLIIGGGYVGVELAAEIATSFPAKKVTLIHNHPLLLERNAEKVSLYAQTFLSKRGVDMILSTKIARMDGKRVIAKRGQSYSGDLIFSCIGTRPQTKNIDGKILNERKEVCIRQTLQIEGLDSVFAGGDIAAISEERTAQNAERHGKAIAENIIRKEEGKALTGYCPSRRPMVISLGNDRGILAMKNFVMTGFFPGLLKRLVEKKVMREYGA
jgi:NADH dehydrogenase FAD-containing subunit